MRQPELLLPAGTLEHLQRAFEFGADAVYAGQPRYSLRVRNNEFQLSQLKVGIDTARQLNKKFYVVSNILPHNAKVKTYMHDMEEVVALNPHALIMADPGLIMMVREAWPAVEIHLSVQANTTNFAAVKFWQKIGIKRIILSRELSLDEIAEIRQECPDIELEVFVHGALCMAYSGRCLLSGYFNHRDPNQGTCTNSCRWEYKLHAAKENDAGDAVLTGFDFEQQLNTDNNNFTDRGDTRRHPLADQLYLLEDTSKPDVYMPITEDAHGTYIMNSKDLCAIEHIPRLVAMGIDSLKIEGRTKSAFYVAITAQAYRQAIDDAMAGRAVSANAIHRLNSLANRGYTDGFYKRHRSAQEQQNYQHNYSESIIGQYVGDVIEIDQYGYGLIKVKNKFCVGDTLDIIHANGNTAIQINCMYDQNNQPITVAQGSGIFVKLPDMQPYNRALLYRVFNHATRS